MFMTWFMFSCNYYYLGISQWANIRKVNSLVVKHMLNPKEDNLAYGFLKPEYVKHRGFSLSLIIPLVLLDGYPVWMPRTKRQCMKCLWFMCLGLGQAYFVLGFWAMTFCYWCFVPRSALWHWMSLCGATLHNRYTFYKEKATYSGQRRDSNPHPFTSIR